MYEAGFLRPLEPLSLNERQRVTLLVYDNPSSVSLIDPSTWSRGADETISLEQVRRALSGIKGSLAEAVSAERDER